MLGVWKKRKGEYVFVKLTDKEAMQAITETNKFNSDVFRQCIAIAEHLIEDFPELGSDGLIKLALALFDKSALQSFSVMKTKLDEPI
jgi:hypothetical protein